MLRLIVLLLMAAGSMLEAKARGKVRIEGKEYVMADGDVVEDIGLRARTTMMPYSGPQHVAG